MNIPMTIATDHESLSMTIGASTVTLGASIGAEYAMVSADTYDGDYTFTPSSATQTIPTSRKLLLDNITINPIPNNYGLITWDGSVITVS